MLNILDELKNNSTREGVLLMLFIILTSGFILTRFTNRLSLPRVSGYILAGIVIGQQGMKLVPTAFSEQVEFISDIALAFIAFNVGKFFKKKIIMRTGSNVIALTLSEALVAGLVVSISLKYIFLLDWDFSLMLGAIATATAPASTLMTISQYKAKGEFVNTLLQIVALDDVVCLLSFSIVSAVINARANGNINALYLALPIIYNLIAIALGTVCAIILSRLLVPGRSRDNRLILVIALLSGLSWICSTLSISPLLSCMVVGAVYINLTHDKKLFSQINKFTPPVMSVFFVISGTRLDIAALKAMGLVGVAYFFIRILAKYIGTYICALVIKSPLAIRRYLGLALVPQAGVAIGLAFLGERILPPNTGGKLLTVILASSVMYEMVGPISAKAALMLSGSIPVNKDICNKI